MTKEKELNVRQEIMIIITIILCHTYIFFTMPQYRNHLIGLTPIYLIFIFLELVKFKVISLKKFQNIKSEIKK